MSNKHRDYTKYAKTQDEPAMAVIDAPSFEEAIEPVETAEVIEPAEPAEAVEPMEAVEPAIETAHAPKIGRVFGCTSLNVRKAPKTNATVICTINCHAEVEIDELESTDDFYKICTASGIEGYCMKKFIRESDAK